MSEQPKFTDGIGVGEAAVLIGCTAAHVRKLLRDGDLVGRKLSPRIWLVSRKSALAFSRNRPRLGRPPQE